ncbi:MAG: ATP-binding cassette domain-containing protein, partial [Parcubacteria group bacterium]
MPAISVKNLNVQLGEHNILKDITFDIEHGEVVAMLGPNGSGKTTLVKTLLGFIPYTGSISILDETPENIDHISDRIGYVP